MNINALPDEILARILSFLAPSDRLESALTCRRWAQIIARTPPLLRDIWLVIGECRREQEDETVVANSHRLYENLRLKYDSWFNSNGTCWIKLGRSVRKLHIDDPNCSPETFYSILQACSNLESLIIDDPGHEMIMQPLSELPQETNLESIQKSMRHMRHLQLRSTVDADVLQHLLILMPNVSSIGLGNLGRTSDVPSRLSNLLGTSRKITSLQLDTADTDHGACEQLLKISSTSLRSLHYQENEPAPTELSRYRTNRVLDVLRNCSMLRHLHLTLESDDTRILQNILPNVPELESFSFTQRGTEARFSREDLTPIFDLRKLRKLYLDIELVSGRNTCVPYEIVGDLSRMISFESLTVKSAFGVVDSICFRILANMPNLRELILGALRWDAECLQTVAFGLRKLRTLQIGGRLSEPVMRDRHPELERDLSIPPDRFRSDRQSDQNFSSLEVLKMIRIPLSDTCLGLISAHHSRLRFVHFYGCDNITGAGLVTLIQHEPLLEGLQLNYNKMLDHTFLKPLGELCRRLRSLEVYSSSRISEQVQKDFRSMRPRVECFFVFPDRFLLSNS